MKTANGKPVTIKNPDEATDAPEPQPKRGVKPGTKRGSYSNKKVEPAVKDPETLPIWEMVFGAASALPGVYGQIWAASHNTEAIKNLAVATDAMAKKHNWTQSKYAVEYAFGAALVGTVLPPVVLCIRQLYIDIESKKYSKKEKTSPVKAENKNV